MPDQESLLPATPWAAIRHAWPDNIRELGNMLKRGLILVQEGRAK